MIRQIIKIDEEKCIGCDLCISACHEGAIGLVNGKAVLLRDDYCDGLGNCLPVCPTAAISFEEREAADFDEAAVKANIERKNAEVSSFVCPGTLSKEIDSSGSSENTNEQLVSKPSQLKQWPIQIKLVSPNASFLKDASLLIAVDCAAYAYGNFHNDYMKNRVTVIGCPKLDNEDYSEKLTAILRMNEIKSVMVVRMEVPCCGGIETAIKKALSESGKIIPWRIVTVTADGVGSHGPGRKPHVRRVAKEVILTLDGTIS